MLNLCISDNTHNVQFANVIIKWGLNGLTTNMRISKMFPIDSEWLTTPHTIQFKTIGGLVKLRMKYKNWASRFDI